jgi:hypothetical protein
VLWVGLGIGLGCASTPFANDHKIPRRFVVEQSSSNVQTELVNGRSWHIATFADNAKLDRHRLISDLVRVMGVLVSWDQQFFDETVILHRK